LGSIAFRSLGFGRAAGAAEWMVSRLTELPVSLKVMLVCSPCRLDAYESRTVSGFAIKCETSGDRPPFRNAAFSLQTWRSPTLFAEG